MLKLRYEGKTVIAITHRLGAALASDRVVLLDKGKVLSDGIHKELIVNNALYQDFWKESTNH